MKKYGLYKAELELLLKNPVKVSWHLQQPTSRRFYADVHSLLLRKRVPVEEIGMIFRQINKELNVLHDNKSAYALVHKVAVGQCSSDDDNSDSDTPSVDEARYIKHNVNRREKRAQSKIKRLQVSCNSLKSVNERQDKQIQQLSAAVKEYRQLICEQNSVVSGLRLSIQCLEESIDFLESELQQLRKEQEKLNEKSESHLSELTKQIEELQQKCEVQTYSSTSFNCNARELYYALLSMRIPPGRIRPIIENVIRSLLPSVSLENIRLPKKSCAFYMRSKEMPTIRHLNSDGTTLHQAKKVGFLINGIVLGVCDVADCSSQTALDALRRELQKLDSVEPDALSRIVSSTLDGALTQSKFNRLLRSSTQGSIVENKCAMHLGVNLQHA